MADVLLDPWVQAIDEFPLTGTPREKFRAALRHAILAPSSHNSQPWVFRVDRSTLELLADRGRALPVVDPEDRELSISCGAALQFLLVTLRHYGSGARVRLLPDAADPDLLARVELGAPVQPRSRDHSLFRAIGARRTNRFPFEPRAVVEPVLGRARAAAERAGAWLQTLTGEDDKDVLADLIAEADQVQMADRRFRRELALWVHANRTTSHDGMPGYSHGVGNLASEVGPIVIRTFDMGSGLAARDRALATASPALAVLWTEQETPLNWLRAGQALAGLVLSLQVDGVATSYLNQPIEIPELRERLRARLGREGFPQIVLRLGYPTRDVRPTPRRSLDEVFLPQ